MLSIKSNMLAQNANRQLNVNTKKSAKNVEKLSSGYKINRAADDSAGLGVSEKMRRQIRGLHQGADNIQDGVGYVQTADGALNESQEILQRINELSIKAANGTNTAEDRFYIDQEIQQLKAELSRIFSTTTYNERKIWEPSDKRILDYDPVQAVQFNSTSETIDITDDNCKVIANGSYQIHADKEEGVYVTWKGRDGVDYETMPISWEKLAENNYSFEMSDYFDKDGFLCNPDNGEPFFKHRISFSVQPIATIDDIIKCIDGVTFSSYQYANMEGRFEEKNGDKASDKGVSVIDVTLSYDAAYKSNQNSGHTFDDADDAFLDPRNASGAPVQGDDAASGGNLTKRPSASNVEQARTSNEGWTFTFYMEGVGEVTATSTSARYRAPRDIADDDYGYWWEWGEEYRNGHWVQTDERVPFWISTGATLGGIMDALTGRKGEDSRPGLLSHGNGGDANGGGEIQISFSLSSGDTYVGSFKLSIAIGSTDTEQDVLTKIQGALDENTILDFYTPSGSSYYAYNSVGTATARKNELYIPIYGGTCGFFVEAGPEAGQHIDIKYDSLSFLSLGLNNTNALTVDAANRAIDEVKKGLQIVSEQRATFGAYQNRLEHAQKINQNSEENTQSAESVIRDTDIAKTMVKYASQNILNQAGASMLAQANQQPGFIMQLLQ